ncbi:hypothetical protein [Methyloprofundus sp.]|uniref:hypothetical protein n=1 Tax=Methyloprofundus sp. TaxID=2020875 RepID=UPI003D14088B
MPMKFIQGQIISILALLMTSIAVYAEMAKVSCVYQTTESIIHAIDKDQQHDHKVRQWYFWRAENQLEVANAEQSLGKKWIYNGQQMVVYQVLYHDRKFVLEFQPTDLKILGLQSNWKMRASLFPPEILTQLHQQGSGKFQEYATVNYQGNVAGHRYQVDWIPVLNLPSRVVKQLGNMIIITQLKEVYPLDKSPYKQLSSDQYDDMEYADIGDNESHPIAAQLQKDIAIGYFHLH